MDFLPSRNVMTSATFILVFVLLTSEVKTSSDLALIAAASLRTFQKHACDGEELRLECPPGTVISISVAQYGRPYLPSSSTGNEPCPPEEEYKWRKGSTQCLAKSALTIIGKTCREQSVCRLWTSPETFQEDPCAGVPKVAEVAYKCRPELFTNRVACEGDPLRLHCEAGYRILIYSAMFGSIKQGVIECPQPKGVDDDDCAVSLSSEIAIRLCGGRRKCSLSADVDSFGSPLCNPRTRKHLKVNFTCVPQEVLASSFFEIDYEEEEQEGDLRDSTRPSYTLNTDPDLSRIRGRSNTAHLETSNPWRPLYTNGTVKIMEMQNDEISKEEPVGKSSGSDQRVVGLIAGNKEKLILYVIVSLGVWLIVGGWN